MRRSRPWQDLIDYAKKYPGKLNLGAINPGLTQNLSAHLFKLMTGIDATIVTYRTTPDLITGVLRGDIDLAFDFYAGFQGRRCRQAAPRRRARRTTSAIRCCRMCRPRRRAACRTTW